MTLPRADRLNLHVPITYRVTGDDHWFQGRTVNISESGVLFEPTELVAGMPVELIFATPVQVGSLASGKLVCAGEVVRTTEMGVAGARFETCRFLLEG